MGDIPSRSIGADAQILLETKCADTLARSANQIDRDEPLAKRNMRVVKNRADSDGVLVLAIDAKIEMPNLSRLSRMLELVNPLALTTRALRALRPADALEMRDAFLFVGEAFNDLEQGWLNRFRRLFWSLSLHGFGF